LENTKFEQKLFFKYFLIHTPIFEKMGADDVVCLNPRLYVLRWCMMFGRSRLKSVSAPTVNNIEEWSLFKKDFGMNEYVYKELNKRILKY
jgi:hypothetical protein